jgi:hypothetical protein
MPADCYNAISTQDGFGDDFRKLVDAIGVWMDKRWMGTDVAWPLLVDAQQIAREISDARFSPIARDAKHLASLSNSLWASAMREDLWRTGATA